MKAELFAWSESVDGGDGGRWGGVRRRLCRGSGRGCRGGGGGGGFDGGGDGGRGWEFAGDELGDEGEEDVGGDGVGFGASGAGDVEAEGFAVEIDEGSAAVAGGQDGVVLDDEGEVGGAFGDGSDEHGGDFKAAEAAGIGRGEGGGEGGLEGKGFGGAFDSKGDGVGGLVGADGGDEGIAGGGGLAVDVGDDIVGVEADFFGGGIGEDLKDAGTVVGVAEEDA